MKRFLVALGLAVSCVASAEVVRPKVVVVAYFEVGKDTGDRPGELQYWVERDHLDRVIAVPGMSRPVHANADGSEIAVAVGPGNVLPGVNLMALGQSAQFDLSKSYWLIQGIAGIAPQDGAVGSAVWTDFVVNGDLAKEVDAREIPKDWPDGFVSLDGVTSSDPKGTLLEEDVRTWTGDAARANVRGNVVRMNQQLMRWAYELTRGMQLPEDAAMKALRAKYVVAKEGPKVMVGANLTTEVFWHGVRMDKWAHRWVGFETDGVAKLKTTAMNDSGSMLALRALTQMGRADWNRALLLRTASNYDMQWDGATAAESLAGEKHGQYTGYLPALNAAYTVGHRVVAEWMRTR